MGWQESHTVIKFRQGQISRPHIYYYVSIVVGIGSSMD